MCLSYVCPFKLLRHFLVYSERIFAGHMENQKDWRFTGSSLLIVYDGARKTNRAPRRLQLAAGKEVRRRRQNRAAALDSMSGGTAQDERAGRAGGDQEPSTAKAAEGTGGSSTRSDITLADVVRKISAQHARVFHNPERMGSSGAHSGPSTCAARTAHDELALTTAALCWRQGAELGLPEMRVRPVCPRGCVASRSQLRTARCRREVATPSAPESKYLRGPLPTCCVFRRMIDFAKTYRVQQMAAATPVGEGYEGGEEASCEDDAASRFSFLSENARDRRSDGSNAPNDLLL